MEIIKGTDQDIPKIMAILEQSVAYFKKAGIDQWQDGYPNSEVVAQDVANGQSYLLVDGNEIHGVMVVMTTPDPNYAQLDKGAWRYHDSYGTVHRIAVNKNYPGRGLAAKLLVEAEKIALAKGCLVMRIDTHEENTGMQHVLANVGYQKIGELTLPDGGKRVALDKKISS